MGGFHLTGPDYDPIIGDTLDSLKLNPDYLIPAHCTGRKACLAFEQGIPKQYLENMAGTRITFQKVGRTCLHTRASCSG